MTLALGREDLTPLSFLARAERLFADRVAVIDGDVQFNYRDFARRVRRLAAVLADAGVDRGDRVAVLATNSPLMLAAHYAVPMVGAVLVALNHRLTPAHLRHIAAHAGAGLVLYDEEFADIAERLGRPSLSAGAVEAALTDGPEHVGFAPDEESLISLNYTSGTTGAPKGVMYAHRGAYLQALAMAYHSQMRPGSVHLWTLPMFHCNGWCFTWAVTAAGATHVCVRKGVAAHVWEAIRAHQVTHLNAAPTVLVSLAADRFAAPVPGEPLRVATGGAPPSPVLLARLAPLNIEVTHLYGLTEPSGPAVSCVWQPEWVAFSA